MSYSNYESLKNYLCANGKSKLERPSPHSRPDKVRVIASSENFEAINIKYHNTIILRFFANGPIQLFMGGWNTTTTRKHMNEFLQGMHVWTEKRNAFVTIGGYYDGVVYEFVEGMVIDPEKGRAYTDNATKELTPYDPNRKRELRKRDKRISKYCDGFIDKLVKRELELPNGGDCFYCQFNLNGNPPISTLNQDGSVTPGMANQADHIESHIEESYHVPSLLMAAIKANEAKFSMWDRHLIGYCWKMHDNPGIGLRTDKYWKTKIKNVLLDYIRGLLGLGITSGPAPSNGF